MATKRMTLKTEYISWENEDTHAITNEMYPVLTLALESATFKGNVPGELGRIYVEVECNNLCADLMRVDPRVEIVGEVDIAPPEEPAAV